MNDLTVIALLLGGGAALVAAALLVVMPARLFRAGKELGSGQDQVGRGPQ